MTSHFVLVDAAANDEADTPVQIYGPYPTRELAEAARLASADPEALRVVGLAPLRRAIDPCAFHPSSAGV